MQFHVCYLVYQSTWAERPYFVSQILLYYSFKSDFEISYMYTMYLGYVHLYSSPQLPSEPLIESAFYLHTVLLN